MRFHLQPGDSFQLIHLGILSKSSLRLTVHFSCILFLISVLNYGQGNCKIQDKPIRSSMSVNGQRPLVHVCDSTVPKVKSKPQQLQNMFHLLFTICVQCSGTNT